MKNNDFDDTNRDITDTLIEGKKEPYTGSDKSLLKRGNVSDKLSMGQDEYEYEKISSQSLPENINKADVSSCNREDATKESSSSNLWFKTWPDQYDKLRSTDSTPLHSPNGEKVVCAQFEPMFNLNENEHPVENVRTTFTLQEALQNISLAYSPLTKQLHLIEKPPDVLVEKTIPVATKTQAEVAKTQKLGHRRTEAGSFSSTVSTLSGISDASTSGSLICSEDMSSSDFEIPNSNLRKKSIANFLSNDSLFLNNLEDKYI